MKKELPDYYVENRNIKEYPTEVGAPKFSPDNYHYSNRKIHLN